MAFKILFVGVLFLIVCFIGFIVLFMACKAIGALLRSPPLMTSSKRLPTVQCGNAGCRSLNPAEARFCGRCGQVMHKHGHQPRASKPLPASA